MHLLCDIDGPGALPGALRHARPQLFFAPRVPHRGALRGAECFRADRRMARARRGAAELIRFKENPVRAGRGHFPDTAFHCPINVGIGNFWH
ncbi:MAG TPA: hypothetical protein VLS49_13205 [Usitatibacter sp.]|nr:hypothetical protein [Usitatibacter sp.]